MRDRSRIWVRIGVWTCLATACLSCSETEVPRPNLVLITIEGVAQSGEVCEVRADAGPDQPCFQPGPGVHYRWAVAPSLDPAPAVTSILTSTYPSEHGVDASPAAFLSWLGPEPIAETLSDAGYATAAFLSGTGLNRSRQLDRGFQIYADEGPDETVIDRAMSWMQTAPRPWFLWVHFSRSSALGHARPIVSQPTAGSRPPVPVEHGLNPLIQALGNQNPPAGLIVTGVGAHSVPTSGPPDARNDWSDREGFRVPLFWQSPRSGTPRRIGTEIDRVVSQLDLAPTLLQAAGLPSPPSYRGKALPEDPRAEPAQRDRTLFAETPEAIAVIQGRDLAVFPLHGPASPNGPKGFDETRHPILLRFSDPPFETTAPDRLEALSAALAADPAGPLPRPPQ